MDFASRLRLPAPLSIISFIFMFLEFIFKTLICFHCRKTDTVVSGIKKKSVVRPSLKLPLISRFFKDGLLRPPDPNEGGRDYSYWRHLAQEYSKKKDAKDKEGAKMEKQLDR